MTLQELKTLLKSISGFSNKVAYEAFPKGQAPSLPFICILEQSSDNYAADNKTFFKTKKIDIEFYSKFKDEANEALIESALDNAGIFYDTTDIYIEDEQCHERVYSIEV